MIRTSESASWGYKLGRLLCVITMMANTASTSAHSVGDISFMEAMAQRDIALLSADLTMHASTKASAGNHACGVATNDMPSSTTPTGLCDGNVPNDMQRPPSGCHAATCYYRLDQDDDDTVDPGLACSTGLEDGYSGAQLHSRVHTLIDLLGIAQMPWGWSRCC